MNNGDMGCCGLACIQCSTYLKEECAGCKKQEDKTCDTKTCCMDKNIDGCYACTLFPCEKDLFKNVRVLVFNKALKQHGKEHVICCLEVNHKNGIHYHPADGIVGDYDKLKTEDEIMNLLLNGQYKE
ncbi:MAG: DUF3795 domain-containing protein [Clostridiales bacterium]|nr:DUF3795 domain-containing protein [Clostridiales bacterium]